MTDAATSTTETPGSPWSTLPRWARIGVVVLAAVVVAIVAIVAVRVATRVPSIPLGVTAVGDLRPGSCVAEDGLDLGEYTVVPCTTAHPQQIFATADLALDADTYALADTALATFGDSVCDHYLEYRLFLREGLVTRDYTAVALAVPDADAYAAGDTESLCTISAAGGDPLTEDLYRPMP